MQASFIVIRERPEIWKQIAVQKQETVYIDLSEKPDAMFPVWKLRAKSTFLSQEYENLTDDDIFFSIIVTEKRGSQIKKKLLKGPWIAPVVQPNKEKDVGMKTVEHTFVFDKKDIDYSNEDNIYQLQVSTNLEEPVPISINILGYSELSTQGIIMAGCIIVFLYILIIFEVVHRTLAAMIGATIAIACLTLIRAVSSEET